VVDTHWHFDHCFGNARFAEAVIYGHETVPAMLEARADEVRTTLSTRSAAWAGEMAALEVVPPSRTFASVAMVDLGDRVVELVHPGHGHTDGDVVVRVPDADVVYAGDLVEESGPPSYGDDSYPLEWGATLDVVAGLLTPQTAVVPGHGAVVDHAYVGAQRADLVGVAGTIRRLVEERVPIAQAWEAAEWPWPRDALTEAIRRGYAQLHDTPGRRTLPLV
jgi:glyoxylase-like metal-dependent hydrolase (beta-lactamase superfamily II)